MSSGGDDEEYQNQASLLISRWSAMALVAIVTVMTLRALLPHSPEIDHDCGRSAGASTDSAAEVKVDNFAFTPVAVTVKAFAQVFSPVTQRALH